MLLVSDPHTLQVGKAGSPSSLSASGLHLSGRVLWEPADTDGGVTQSTLCTLSPPHRKPRAVEGVRQGLGSLSDTEKEPFSGCQAKPLGWALPYSLCTEQVPPLL